MAKSERVHNKSTKSTTYFNYLNNRMSVRIKLGGPEKSLAKRLLESYADKRGKNDIESEFDRIHRMNDLENPLLDPNMKWTPCNKFALEPSTDKSVVASTLSSTRFNVFHRLSATEEAEHYAEFKASQGKH